MIEYLGTGEVTKFCEMVLYDHGYVEHLVGYGLVIQRGEDYEFAFESAEEAVKRAVVATKTEALPDRWAEISRRRNRIEEEIRGALYQWSARLSSAEWIDALQKCVSEKRMADLGLLSRQEAFSKNRSPLYFVELLKFIQHSGQYDNVESSFGSISKAMNLVNALRIDAHAKDIDQESYNSVVEALNTLEMVFVPPP
jgi:hypothetical protein